LEIFSYNAVVTCDAKQRSEWAGLGLGRSTHGFSGSWPSPPMVFSSEAAHPSPWALLKNRPMGTHGWPIQLYIFSNMLMLRMIFQVLSYHSVSFYFTRKPQNFPARRKLRTFIFNNTTCKSLLPQQSFDLITCIWWWWWWIINTWWTMTERNRWLRRISVNRRTNGIMNCN
jgi:hypothetical protein